MKIDFVKTLEASSPYIPGRIYFEESTSLIKVATASNQYRVFGGVRSAEYDSSTDILTIQNGNGDEIYIDFSQYVNQDEYEDDQYVVSVALTELNNSISSISDNVDYLNSQVSDMGYSIQELQNSIPVEIIDVGTISFNSNNQAALPAGTYTEALNAYNNGKSIIIRGSSGDVTYDYVLEMWSTGNNLYFTNIYGNNRCILMSNDTLWIFNSIFPNETDPIFSASPAAGITSTDITNWNNKVSNVQADWNASSGLAAILNKPVIPGDASVAAWGYLKANDVSTKVDKSNAVSSLSLAMNSSTYTITLSGTMADGSTFTVGNPVDLPLETMVVDGSYNSSTKKVVLGLKNGSSVEFSVADLVAGLQSEITSSNKLSADLIQDGTTNKVVTATDKNNWNSLVSNVQSDWNATTGLAAILNKPDLSLYMTIEDYEEDEEVVAASLNDLNDRILTLTSQIPTDASVSGWGYIKSYTETDPTVPAWAKAANKPTYTAAEVGALPDTTTIPTQTTDASVAAWGYIKTIADASIAALGYTKNTGTLTGVKFNNTNATINGTVAEITATIPTVNNATLSILKNGTSVGTFTANSSTDTSINIQVNELPTPSTVGPMLVSRYNAQSQVTEWAESTNIFDISNTIHLGFGIPLVAHGSYGDTVLATGGILKTNFSDWSWINIQYQENNTTVTKNLQDYLDESIVFPSTAGRIAESYYNSTTQRNEWKASDIYSFTSPHSILAQPTGGFSVLKNTTDNPRTVYSLGAGGVGGANTTDWSWIKRWSNNVTTTLQDDLNAKQDTLVGSGTGQNIKTVNNNSLVGSGNVSVGTLTGVKFNNVSATINGTVAEITATIPAAVTESTVSGWGFTKNAAPGTLTTTSATGLSAATNEALSGSISLHKVSKTGSYNDLLDKPSIPAAQVQSDWNATSGMGVILNKPTIPSAPGTLKTNNTTAQTASASESLSGTINLHKVAKTGTYSDLIGTPTIPAAANNATITIQKGGTTVNSFTVDASSNKTINIPNELPTVTSTDNGKILEVVNGAWAAASPITVYSGSNAPNNSTGINGDIYIQS